MKVKELRERLERMKDDDIVVVRIHPLSVSIGGTPCTPIKNAFSGIDWDHGKLLLQPEERLTPCDPNFDEERKLQNNLNEALGFIWLHLTSKSLDDKQKLKAIRETLKKRAGFD